MYHRVSLCRTAVLISVRVFLGACVAAGPCVRVWYVICAAYLKKVNYGPIAPNLQGRSTFGQGQIS